MASENIVSNINKAIGLLRKEKTNIDEIVKYLMLIYSEIQNEKELCPEIKRTERGWGGHYICALRCRFRRNTLLEYKDTKIVISTVGLKMSLNDKTIFEPVDETKNSYFETKVFYTDPKCKRWHDADISNEIKVVNECYICSIDADDKANKMHENVVNEIIQRIGTL